MWLSSEITTGKMSKSRVLIVLMVATNVQFLAVQSAPLGKNAFANQSSDRSKFWDKAYDEEFTKVPYVGNNPVPALEKYSNSKDQDNAQKEVDNFPSNVYSKYDNIQKKIKDWFDTEPLIDNIREEDKYGNEGDQFYFFTKPLVKLTETMALITNKIIAAPRDLFKSAKKSISDKVNNIGGSLVGLRK
ncbi:uncharacterized protein LOC129768532 [Toxorhynchites rutilus septentrionalis]|uniref:uncharacterized protein LOC129768532 n=1 Tax=Toxorhynchites rutilus septentrionalis TaxID=329112 RepID=UPI00247AE727|nr:uncharacterized protein LOC129768532 [Toxorhynchites rutilus septentrionalis]